MKKCKLNIAEIIFPHFFLKKNLLIKLMIIIIMIIKC